MNKIKLSAVLVAGFGLAFAVVGESADPVAYDGLWTGLQYEMRLSEGADYNRLVNSGENGREVVQVPNNYTGSDPAPEQPSFQNVSYTRFGISAAETERAIVFPGSSYLNDAKDRVYYFKNGAKLLDRAVSSEELTIHLRLRQDGLAANKKVTYFIPVFQNGWSESGDKGCGFKIGFTGGDTSTESMMPMLHFGKKYIIHNGSSSDGQMRPWLVLEKGKWYDWVLRLKADGQGATHYRFALFNNGGGMMTFDGYASNDCLRATCTNPTMTLGTDLASGCAKDWSSAAVGDNYVSIFKGAVSQCRVWNRELTDEEIRALVFVADGRKWSIGVKDGKADEFAVAAEEQRVFDPRTMEWFQFPKSLTKASPSVTISDVFAEKGITANGYAQWLDVQPLTNALPANAKVEVRANGRYLGTYDLAQEDQRCIPLPCGRMGADANGRIAVTLTRIGDRTEPLTFDAVSLTAGCKISDETVGADGFSYTSNRRFSFDETVRPRCRCVLLNTADEGGANYYQEYAFDMPAAVAGKADVRYDLTFGTKSPAAGDPVKVFLNGEEVTEIPAGQSDYGIVKVTLPREKILAGYNVIRIELVSSTSGHYQYLHAHALSFIVPEGTAEAVGLSDGLVYDLAFDGSGTFNRLCNSGASGRQTTFVNESVGTVPAHIPALPSVASRDITLRYDTLTDQPCVVFPANVYTNDSAAIRCCRKGLRLSDSCVNGEMTVHLRFRYDGRPINQITYFIPMFQNGWSKTKKTGFWMGLSDQSNQYGNSIYPALRFGEKYHIFGYGASYDGKSLPLTLVQPKRWYDWIVRVRPNGDGTTSYDTRLVCAATDPIIFSHDAVAHDALRTVTGTTNPTMTLGCVGANAGDSDWRSSSIGGEGDDEGGIFNGSIAKCRVWNRCISDAEIAALLKQQDGTKWSVGVKDGTSDEFAAAEAADVARTYDPQTMDWRRFPKGLTADEPSVTIRDSFAGSHVYYARNFHYLSIEPVEANLPANANVLVTVNGREIASVDLADDAQRTVLLPASAMRKDGDGKISVTIRRVGADLSGTLVFDALSLVGGGQVGEVFEVSQTDGYGTNYHNRQFAFGDMSSAHCTETMGSSYWGADNEKLDFALQIPQRLAGSAVLRYETRVKPQYGQLGREPFQVLFNGTLVKDYADGCADGEKIVLDLPADLVRPGLNTVRLLNCVTDDDLPSGKTVKDAYLNFDYHKLTFVAEDVKLGMMLMLR